MSRPKLRPHDSKYLQAFQVLGRSRQVGMSMPQPLTLQEMQAYFQIYRVERAAERRYVQILQDLDTVYLTHHAEQAETARRKADKS